jgi:CubicO group peptidase (beta-lactamase class C family)
VESAIENPLTPDEWIGRVATLPLIDQPGAGFRYSISTIRRARLCGFDHEGRLTMLAATPGRHAPEERPDDMTFESAGQGLWSTVDDYLASAGMLLRDPHVPALLHAETRELMTSNQLTLEQRAAARMFGQSIFAVGYGCAMGVAVVLEPDLMRCGGGIGTIGWPGAYGGWWQADPNDRSVLIFLAHNTLELSQMAQGIGLGVWNAFASFHAIAMDHNQ